MSVKKSDLWVNKWRPNNIKDVIGNKTTIDKLEDWISNFDTHNDNTIIVSGGHGIGKTMTVQLLLEKYNYQLKIIYPDGIKSYRTDMDFDDYYNYNNSINSKIKMKSNNNKKIALVFDESESITLTSERKYVLNIYKLNSKNKSFPLIFISNINHSKLINDLKKYCLEFKMFSPSSYELIPYIKNICKEENIEIVDMDSINTLIQFSQYDIRRLVNILQEYHYNFDIMSSLNINKFIEESIMKDTDIGLYDASMNLINNKYDHEQIYKLYETDKVLVPLMINENY